MKNFLKYRVRPGRCFLCDKFRWRRWDCAGHKLGKCCG